MKLKSSLLTAFGVVAIAVSTAQANQIVSYSDTLNTQRVGLFNDAGTLLMSYSDSSSPYANIQRITQDSSGNLYVADASLGILKFNIATGAFAGNIFTTTGYQITGVGFNPNQPSNILYAGNIAGDPAGSQQLGIINSSTGAISASFTGGGYNNVSFDPASGRIVSALTGNNISQGFNATTAAFIANMDTITGGPQTVITLGGIRYYGTQDGKIRDQSNAIILDFRNALNLALPVNPTANIYQLETDGTNLLAADIGSGLVYIVSTTGTLVDSFDVGLQARGVTFTTVPEPSTYALLGLSGLGLCAFRRRFRKA